MVVQHMLLVVQHMLRVVQHMCNILRIMLSQLSTKLKFVGMTTFGANKYELTTPILSWRTWVKLLSKNLKFLKDL